MKIVSYNVNGIRAALNKGLLDWIKAVNADVVCFQEIKANADQIPVKDFEVLGYHTYWNSAQKKGYSGVGIISRQKPLHVEYGMGMEEYDGEGRMLRADFEDVSIISVYHPSGTTGDVRQTFKYRWLDDFHRYVLTLRKSIPNLVISGDYNICHRPIDIHDPIRNATSSGFLPEEREWMTKFLDSGFIDSFRHLIKDPHNYTWWSYRVNARERNLGWRIDYHMVTDVMKDKIMKVAILDKAYHSDHCPIVLEIA